MSAVVTKLINVPRADPWEAPASWLSRIALSQGVSMAALLSVLEIGLRSDVDRIFLVPSLMKRAGDLGIDLLQLAVAHRLYSSFHRAGLDHARFLLSHNGRPRYRFCAACLSEMRTPSVAVHWRFACWRVCPLHSCLMEDTCPHCNSFVVLPASMIVGGPKAGGVAYVSRCLVCDKPLTSRAPLLLDTPDGAALLPWERSLASNGRAVLAALYFGHLREEAGGVKRPLRRLTGLARSGLLPHSTGFLNANAIRERIAPVLQLTNSL